MIGIVLICLWIGSPALACLPNAQMTPSEMECRKKMAGDCHMGAGQHPGCKTVSNVPAPIASIHPISQPHPAFAVTGEIANVPLLPRSEAKSERMDLGLPPSAPPGQNSILRI